MSALSVESPLILGSSVALTPISSVEIVQVAKHQSSYEEGIYTIDVRKESFRRKLSLSRNQTTRATSLSWGCPSCQEIIWTFAGMDYLVNPKDSIWTLGMEWWTGRIVFAAKNLLPSYCIRTNIEKLAGRQIL